MYDFISNDGSRAYRTFYDAGAAEVQAKFQPLGGAWGSAVTVAAEAMAVEPVGETLPDGRVVIQWNNGDWMQRTNKSADLSGAWA